MRMRFSVATESLYGSTEPNPDAQLEQIAEINRALDEKGIVLDCDPRKVSKTGTEQASVKEDSGNPPQEVQ